MKKKTQGSTPWFAQDVALLRRLARTHSQRQIARRLGRSMKAVERKIHHLRYRDVDPKDHPVFVQPPKWSSADIAVLLKLYKTTPYSFIAECIGRTLKAVRRKADKLHLRKRRRKSHLGGDNSG